MERGTLVIWDDQVEYGHALSEYLKNQKSISFQVIVCTNEEEFRQIRKKGGIELLLLGEAVLKVEDLPLSSNRVCVLTQEREREEKGDYLSIYRYQPGEQILNQILSVYQGEELGLLFSQGFGGQEIKIIGVLGWTDGKKTATYALDLGEKLSGEGEVLYINMRMYGYSDSVLQTSGSVEDGIYFIHQEKGKLGRFLATAVCQRGRVDVLGGVRCSRNILEIALEEWKDLFLRIGKESVYEILILDLDYGLPNLYELMKLCKEVHVLEEEERDIGYQRQLELELDMLGYQEVKEKLRKGRRVGV